MILKREKRFAGQRRSKKAMVFNPVYLYSFLFISLLVLLSFSLVYFDKLTIGGVPFSIVKKFLGDSEAVNAYFNGNGRRVHDRLQLLQIEKDIKDYYRKDIPDELELDRYIHQLLYERTGYVGVDYQLTSSNQLILKNGIRSPSMTYK